MPASPAPTIPPQPGPFICYSRKDRAYVHSLVDALAERGREAWVDWQDVLPTAEWMRAIQAGIDAAPAVLVVLSPDAATSEICAQEIAYAVGQNKRLIPILCRPVDAKTVAEPVRKLNWVDLQGERLPQAGIDVLLTALDIDLAWVHAHSRLLQQAGEWNADAQDPGRLLRGAPLAQAERWLGRTDTTRMPQPTALQLQYVLASGKAQARRRRLMLAGVSGALAVTAALAIVAVVQSRIADQQRNTAVSRLLAAQSAKNTTEATGRLDLALLQAVAALRLDATDEARASLLQALLATDRVRRFVQAPGTLLSVALHPDGRTLATGGFDGTLTLWDVQTLQPKATLRDDPGGVRALAFSPDGRTLASAGVKGVVVREAGTAQPRARVDVPRGGVSRLAWHPGSHTLFAAGLNEGALHIVEMGEPVRSSAVAVHRRGLRDMALSADARTLAIAVDGDAQIRLWDVEGRRERQRLTGHEGAVKALAYSRDGSWLASAGDDGVLRLWDAPTGVQQRVLEGPSAQVARLAFSLDGRWLATGSDNRGVTLWPMNSDGAPETLRGHGNGVMDLVFSPDASTLFSVAFTDTFIAWNLGQRRQASVLTSHDGDVTALAVSRDGKLLASGGDDGAVRLWNLPGQALLGTMPGHRGPLRTLAFSPDGATLASGSDDDRLIRLWDVAKRQPRQPLDARGEVTGLDFSPDGTLLASAAEGRSDIQLWNAVTAEPAAELKGHEGQVNALVFSRDGRKLVSGGSADQAVRVWDPVARSPLGEAMVIGASVAQVAISPDGASVASSGHWPGGVLLWEIAGDVPPVVVQEPGGGGDQRLAFSPDGRMLAHATDELRSSIVLWGLASRRPMALLNGRATTLALAFTPDGRQLASGHAGGEAPGTIVLWNTEVERWPERACEIANRNPTREEWQASVGPGLPYRVPCPSLPPPKD